MKLNAPLLLLSAVEEYLDPTAYRPMWGANGICFYAACYAKRRMGLDRRRDILDMHGTMEEFIVAAGLLGYFRSVDEDGLPIGYVGGETGRTLTRLQFAVELRNYLYKHVGLA